MCVEGPLECDILVIGSGAGGLTAAVTARHLGCKVLVVEKASQLGGTSALSGGWIWAPASPASVDQGTDDSIEQAQVYVAAEVGDHYDPDLTEAYLKNAPRMIEFLERETSVKFTLDNSYPDYHPDQPGGRHGGRSLIAAPFDLRQLGQRPARLRPPLRTYTLFGMAIGAGPNLKHFMNASRSFASACHVFGQFLRHGFEVLRYGHGVRLFNGNALIGRLIKSADDLGVEFRFPATAKELIVEKGQVRGAIVELDGVQTPVRARKSVILAAGGFSQAPELRHAHYPKEQRISIAPHEISGDGVRMALSIGAHLRTKTRAAAYSGIFSSFKEADGTTTHYPHFVDRAKPGVILVNSEGRRFCNEANSYHDVSQAMISEGVDGVTHQAFLIADHKAVRRYSLGAMRPIPFSIRRCLKAGYAASAPNIRALARKIGVDEIALEDTVQLFNLNARIGCDPCFDRGTTAYNVFQGDELHQPNPCLGPVERAPFYALPVCAGDFGSFVGLVADASARVLDEADSPIPGLYAVGNDSANLFGGVVPAAGVTIGPAMVFGFVAARNSAEN